MEHWVLALLGAIVRVAAIQAAAVCLLACLIGRRWPTCPRACRWACLLILFQGWILSPWTLSIPWYDPITPAESPLPAVSSAAELRQAATLQVDSLAATGNRPPTSAVRVERGSDWFRFGAWLLVVVWLGGMVAIVAAMFLRYVHFLRMVRPEPAQPEWLDEWNAVLQEFGARRSIPLVVTGRLGPMLCLRPRGPAVLVPADLWELIAPPSRQAILRHELAHYLRGDAWKSLLMRVLALPQWFHPAVWWAVRMFQQCGEWSCDRWAARTDSEKVHYASGLAQLAGLRLAVGGVGVCAHSHPLVLRVQMLLQNSPKENDPMRKISVLVVAALLLAFGAIRVELVAKQPASAKDSLEDKMQQLDKTITDLSAKVDALKQSGEGLNNQVEERLAKLTELYQSGNFSDAMQNRLSALEAGDEDRQQAALDNVQSLGDEGAVLLALAAGHSSHEAVRRKAVKTIVEWGPPAYPAIHHAFESLSDADRIFLAELLIRKPTDDHLIGLAGIVKRSSTEVRKAVIDFVAKSPKCPLLLAVIAQQMKDDNALAANLIDQAARLEGDDGLALLYAVAAHGSAAHRVAAIKAAVARKQEALPVLAAAFKSNDPQVRAEFVRAAKAIGGPLAENAIQMALADPDESLRQAAEKALAPAESPGEKQ